MNYPAMKAEAFISEADYRKRAIARRKRLLRPANAVKEVTILPPPLPKPRSRIETQHDAHVKTWQLSLAEQANKCRYHILKRCADLGVSYKDIVGQSRVRAITDARQLLMYEIKTQVKPSISLPELGRLFGGRDHTTCLHAIVKHGYQKGEGNRLSPSEVDQIRRLYADGMMRAEIAVMIGCHVETVSRYTDAQAQAAYEVQLAKRRKARRK